MPTPPPETSSPPAAPEEKKKEDPVTEPPHPLKATIRISPLMLAMMPPGAAAPAPSPPSGSSLATTDPGRHTTEPEMPAVDLALGAEVAPAFNLAPGQPLPKLVPDDEAAKPAAEVPASAPAPARLPWGWLLVAGLASALLAGSVAAVFHFLPSEPDRRQDFRPATRTAVPTHHAAPTHHSAPAASDDGELLESLAPGSKPSPTRAAVRKHPPPSHDAAPPAPAPAPAPPPSTPAAAASPPPSNDFGFLPADAPPPKAPLKRPGN